MFILINNRQQDEIYAQVDAEDYDRMIKYNWHLSSHGYAETKVRVDGKEKTVGMHRLIMNVPIGDARRVDHMNSDTLDNRKLNLRVCTKQQNEFNRKKNANNPAKYKGLTWMKSANKWAARVGHNGKLHYLGCFDSQEDAARAYNAKAAELFGEFAQLNVIE